MKRILIIRLSSLGDVAIAAHIVQALNQQRQDIELTVLTKEKFKSIFEPLGINIETISDHARIKELIQRAKEIEKKHKIDYVADLHSVLRSWVVDGYFWLKGKKIAIINKGKKEKRKLTRRRKKILKKLKHTAERYAEVFEKIGIAIDLNKYKPNYSLFKQKKAYYKNQNITLIGFAPFAAHKTKEYPVDKTEKIIQELNKLDNFEILIFGGGKREKQIAQNWANKFSKVKNLIGKHNLQEEISIIGELDLIVTMDSGNMHLASLTGTKNITIWGGTHPYLGFAPFKNFDENLAIQKDLPCRPCSVFGSEKCYRKDFECLNIEPETILNKIKETCQENFTNENSKQTNFNIH